MLFGLMGKHALKRFDFEISADSLDIACDHLICVLWFDSPCCRLKSIPCGHESISLFTLGLPTDDKTVSALSWVAVNVCSDLDFDKVFHLQFIRVFFKWRKMTTDFINRNAAWPCNTSFEFFRFLTAESFLQFFFSEFVYFLTNLIYVCSFNTALNGQS